MRYRVTVAHNMGPGRFIGYGPDDPLERVFELDIEEDSPEAACELVFAICNSAPDELFCPAQYAGIVQRYRALELRSLSVGDVLVLCDQDRQQADAPSAWHCAAGGFDRLPTIPADLGRGGRSGKAALPPKGGTRQ